MFICITVCHSQSTSMDKQATGYFPHFTDEIPGLRGEWRLAEGHTTRHSRTGMINLIYVSSSEEFPPALPLPPPRHILLSYNTRQGCVQKAASSSKLNCRILLGYLFSDMGKKQCTSPNIHSLTLQKAKRLSAEELMLSNCGAGEDSWESLGLRGDPTSQS